MKSAEDIIGILADRIGNIYERPMGFGRDLACVDSLLWGYHDLWAEIMDTTNHFPAVLYSVMAEEDSEPNVTLRFDEICARNGQLKDEEDRLRHFIGMWRKVSDRLEVPIQSAKQPEVFRRHKNNDKS